MIGRLVGLLSIPLVLLTIRGLVRQVRNEQRITAGTAAIGLVMAPLALLVNIVFLRQASPEVLGPMLLLAGLGLGLAWGQATRLHRRGPIVVGRRGAMHLVFWAISYGITQLLALVAPAYMVAGGIAAMFFSAGSSLGANLNLLARLGRLKRAPGPPEPAPAPAGPARAPRGLPEK
jgi:hypothetical protein